MKFDIQNKFHKKRVREYIVFISVQKLKKRKFYNFFSTSNCFMVLNNISKVIVKIIIALKDCACL